LDPVELVGSAGFRAHELSTVEVLIKRNREVFLEARHEFFVQ